MTDEQELTPEDEPTEDAEGVTHASEAAGDDTPRADQPLRTEPPRAFDDEAAEPAGDETAPEDDTENAEPEPEVVADGVEPEAPEAFEDLDQLPALLEALLFVADHPIDLPYLSRAVEVSQARVERALDELSEALRESARGIRLQRGPAGVQLTSAPEAAPFVERFLGLEATRRLSTAALETLAIIAYRQPITRGQIDTIRGVSSDGAVATLRARDLIESAGHAPGPGRPMLFRTTGRFLEHFGLERPGQLPPLPEDIDLPPSEIQATLGLDDAAIEEALRPREPEPAEEATEPSEADAAEAPQEAANAEPEDDMPTAEDEALDELIQAVAASEATGVDIPSDVQALSAAAEHAFIASRDRAEADEEDDGPEDEADVED